MTADHFLKIENFSPGMVLENRLEDALLQSKEESRESLAAKAKPFLDAVAAPTVAPGGGSVAALAAALAASLGQMVSGLSRAAVLWNGANPANALAWRETEGAARALGVTLQSHDVRGLQDFNTAFATMAQQRPDAVSVLADALITQYQKEIVDFAINERLPSVFPSKDPIKLGGLLSYGPHYSEMMRRAASQVDKILRGTQPADLPMELPTTFELIINLNTARAVGVVVPPLMLARADEVIE